MATLKPTAEATLAVPLPEKVRLEVPHPVFLRYQALAANAHMDVEEYMAEHLKQTIDHDHSSASLHFNASAAARLCKLTGRGQCNDAEVVLQRLEALATVKLGDIPFPIDANERVRLSHVPRVRSGRMSMDEFVKQAARNGLRGEIGLHFTRA